MSKAAPQAGRAISFLAEAIASELWARVLEDSGQEGMALASSPLSPSNNTPAGPMSRPPLS